jgi:2-keto-4-pentenoate hydratase
MTPDAVASAARHIARARYRKRRIDGLPDNEKPTDTNAGYAIQEALHSQLDAPVAGFKIGCTTAVMQRFLNIDQPCAGRILETDVHASPVSLPHASFHRVGVECEIAVRLGQDLPPREVAYDRRSVADAVATCMAAIEIVDDRYVDYTKLNAPTLIADDFFGGCVLGAAHSRWEALSEIAGTMFLNGEPVGSGTGAQVMEHPFEALAWLANTLASRGQCLSADDIVLTGSIVETHWVNAGDHIKVSIDGLGDAEAIFT